MSAARKTPVPLPGPKSKTKPKIVSSQAALSQEFVDSDDDSSNDNTPQPNPAQAAAKARTTIAVHRPKANGASNSTSNSAAKSKASTTKSSSKVSAPQKKPAPKEVAKKPQHSDSSSSEETGDDSEDDVTTPPRSEKKTKDSSESNSESSGDDSDEEETTQKVRPPITDRRQASQSQSHTVEIRQTQPYIPPKGFSAIPMNQNAMSQAAKIFENLQGKQVWHITAPANVSLKDLKEMTMEKALGGEAVLKYKGAEYGFSTMDKSEEGARELMIPHQNGYKAVPSKIFQTLHLQEVVRLPEANPYHAEPSANSEDTASITRSTIRAPRPQVKGLKMRFFLSGFGDREPGTLGESDSEDERQPSGLVIPNGVNLPAKSEKRKRHSANGDAGLESPTKKHKKQLTAEEIKRKGEKRAKKESKRAKESAKGK